MKMIITALALLTVAFSCKPATSKETNADVGATAAVAAAAPEPKSPTSFMINGVAASVTKGSSEPGVNYNTANKNMRLFVFGDVAGQPHPGMLEISLMSFELKAGVYVCKASFTRYTKPGGGGQNINYSTKNFNLVFSEIKATDDKRVFLVSGAFEGKIPLAPFEKQDVSDAVLDIREGKFENIKLTLLGKID